MRRWRTRGYLVRITAEGAPRQITGTPNLGDGVVPVMKVDTVPHHGAHRAGSAKIRMNRHGEIQALLPWRWRHANLDLGPCRTTTAGVVTQFHDPPIRGLTLVGPGMNPWGL